MENNPSTRIDNNYDGLNLLDGSPQHPNKYELQEKRKEQIVQAIGDVLADQKDDVLKRPIIGIATLIRRELQRKAGTIIRNEQEQGNFDAEYNTDAIITELCKIVSFGDKNDYTGLKKAVDIYLGSNY